MIKPELDPRTEKRLRKIRERGLARVAWDAVARRVYRRVESVYFERDLSPLKRRYRLREGMSVRHAPTLSEAACRKHFEAHWEVYKRLLGDGLTPIVALDEGNVVAITWFAERDYYDADIYNYRFPVEPDQVYQFAGELAEPYRRRAGSIPAAVLDTGWAHFREQGKKRTYAISDVANVASQRLHINTGFHEVGRKLVTRTILGKTWSHEEPYVGSMSSSAAPSSRRPEAR